MDTNLLKRIKKILKNFPKYWKNEELQRYLVINDLRKYDIPLISALLKDEKVKELYTLQIDNITIFKQEEFIDMFRYKQYWANSYTKYSNEIGLSSEGKYLKYNSDVVLDFPYKDCILEGGMTKEDVGKEEIYYNEIIAKDEIDTLLAPKVFTNTKMYDNEGEHEVTEITDENNLIIKGNNLLALNSLKERYKGSIQMIYLDIPYNTRGDSFRYNDRFNHSTWLTFIKNRIEIARELLKNNGTIFIHVDYNEIHYLKVLLDEIFGRDNFINEIIWRRKQSTSYGKNKFGIINDTILYYSKEKEYYFTQIYSKKDENTQKYIKERFIYKDKDGRLFMKSPLVNSMYRPNLKYVFKGVNPPQNGWLYSKAKMDKLYNNNELIIPQDKNARIYRKIYLDKYKGQVVQNMWLDIPIVNPMAKEQVDFQTQKPENLLKRIIECSTSEGDIVLDFFMGSATTQAVAMKLKRRFIGVEQMNYINKVSIPRLQKVITGEQGGISKDVDWQGGGSFIYTELKQLNQIFVDKILSCNSSEKLINILNEMKKDAYLDFKVNVERLESQPMEIEGYDIKMGFKDLPLDKQKEILIGILDKNQLYINYSDIDDEDYQISDKDKMFNYSFYQVRGGKLQCLKDYMKN